MYYFDVVAVVHEALRPETFRYDLAIDFDRNRKPAIANCIEQGCDAGGLGKIVRHTVQLNFRHPPSLAAAAACAKGATSDRAIHRPQKQTPG